MLEFTTSLLREKFTIHDLNANPKDRKKPAIALSNRIIIELKNTQGKLEETLIIRSHNMHSCVRMSAKILQSFGTGGALLKRHEPFDWEATWKGVINEYEKAYNPKLWISIYNKGQVIFEKGPRHPLLDIIEKCDARNKGEYEDSVSMAEDAFKQTGKTIKIEYDGNVALVVNFEQTYGRCGVILRGADKTRTFNFSVAAKDKKKLNFAQTLSVSAAFLEGIQLAFLVGMNEEKIRLEMIKRGSDEAKQTIEARRRLARLGAEVTNLENGHDVKYRPERPEFDQIILDAEQLAQKILS